MLEIGYGQQAAVEATAACDWSTVSFIPDLQGIPRVVQAQCTQAWIFQRDKDRSYNGDTRNLWPP